LKEFVQNEIRNEGNTVQLHWVMAGLIGHPDNRSLRRPDRDRRDKPGDDAR